MSDQLESIQVKALQELEALENQDALREWRSQYLGTKGIIKDLLARIGSLPAEERHDYGQNVNILKNALTDAFEIQQNTVRDLSLQRDIEGGSIDITLPGRSRPVGRLHPATQTLRRFYSVWADMGFQVFRSRDVEDDETNFTLLNMPPHHPARDMQDTFYTTDANIIMRTHTSGGQIHAMRALGAGGTKPIRVILPGMCYRFEQITARSEVQFHQVEGLAIGRNIHLSDLKGTITEFVHRMYGVDTAVRFRSSYFPFTEPSMEIDIASDDERLTKGTGWLEIAGCGMVHPEVLRNGGYDPELWSGFAFGMGPERITMLKHQIQDIRYFWSNDLRFLNQF